MDLFVCEQIVPIHEVRVDHTLVSTHRGRQIHAMQSISMEKLIIPLGEGHSAPSCNHFRSTKIYFNKLSGCEIGCETGYSWNWIVAFSFLLVGIGKRYSSFFAFGVHRVAVVVCTEWTKAIHRRLCVVPFSKATNSKLSSYFTRNTKNYSKSPRLLELV